MPCTMGHAKIVMRIRCALLLFTKKAFPMADLVIADVDAAVLVQLAKLANRHGRTASAEAKVILSEALQTAQVDPWVGVDAIRERLAATGRTFSESADLLREDRNR